MRKKEGAERASLCPIAEEDNDPSDITAHRKGRKPNEHCSPTLRHIRQEERDHAPSDTEFKTTLHPNASRENRSASREAFHAPQEDGRRETKGNGGVIGRGPGCSRTALPASASTFENRTSAEAAKRLILCWARIEPRRTRQMSDRASCGRAAQDPVGRRPLQRQWGFTWNAPPSRSDLSPSRPRIAQTAHRAEASCAKRLAEPMPMTVRQKHPRFVAGFDGNPRS